MTSFFLVDERRKDPNTTKRAIIGPPAKRHLNGVSLVGRWWPNIECCFGSFVVVLQRIRTSFAKKPYCYETLYSPGWRENGKKVYLMCMTFLIHTIVRKYVFPWHLILLPQLRPSDLVLINLITIPFLYFSRGDRIQQTTLSWICR